MFSVNELSLCLSQAWLVEGYAKLERNLLLSRLALPSEGLSAKETNLLRRFSQSVIASASTWTDLRSVDARTLCQRAADIEAGFAVEPTLSTRAKHLSLLKALILYDLAGLPGASATHATRNGFDNRFRQFFTRDQNSIWGAIVERNAARSLTEADVPEAGTELWDILNRALGEIADEAGVRIQNLETGEKLTSTLHLLAKLASEFDLPITGDDLHALAKLINCRERASTLSVVTSRSAIEETELRKLSLPVELWPAQVAAVEGGILSTSAASFGFAAPTGTGKTSLTRLLIAETITRFPRKKVLYICPTRALVRQVTNDLATALNDVALRVIEVGAHLTVHDKIPLTPEDADVLVFTPERADLLLRVDPDFLQDVCLVIVDEAHLIEQAVRGVLLEFYLWRVRRSIPETARIVQLSAVAPNIGDLTDWLAPNGSSKSVVVDWRSNRLRVGVLERATDGAAQLTFGEAPPYTLLGPGTLPQSPLQGLAILADHLSKQGIVLVLCTSVRSAEEVAKLISDLRENIEQDTADSLSIKLDAWIERELYPESDLRNFYKHRVIFHHARLPPRVRHGLEEAIKNRKVDVICATTTLAEGVNFPFSTVIVESLVGRDFQLSPRALWNIAGRAGRFGVDTEGHCILYRPSLWRHKIEQYQFEDYLRSNLTDIPPVRSALASGVEKLKRLVETRTIAATSLSEVSLSDITVDGKATALAKEVRALVNIMRVGYAHASSSKIISLSDRTTPEFDSELLASRQLSADVQAFAKALASQQREVIRQATNDNEEFVQIAARVGWSLETQKVIHDWVATREDWQLEQFGHVVVAGSVRNFDRLGYLIGPLAKNLLAFEGTPLGGVMSFTAQKWIEGIPLAAMADGRGNAFTQLVNNIYGRIQFLLPWGLYGLHELLEYEARRRSISVDSGVRDLSVLAAEGVPNFDALQLLQFGVERVDAARLSQQYQSRRRDTDIYGWFKSSRWAEIERIVRGSDRRRVDPNLPEIHAEPIVR